MATTGYIDPRDVDFEHVQEYLVKPPMVAGRLADRIVADAIVGSHHRQPIVADTPCKDPGSDAFSFDRIARDLSRQLLSAQLETPYTLCIDGEWGVGKSSLARLVFYHLSSRQAFQRKTLPIWIDTSLIDGTERVLEFFCDQVRSVAVDLSRRLTAKGKSRNELLDGPLLPAALFSADAPISESSARKTCRVLRSDAHLWQKEWGQRPDVGWKVPDLQELLTSIRFGLLGRGGLSRIVLFVDDLDRCRPDVIMRILDLHRTLLEIWGVALVYPMNASVVESVVESHFISHGSPPTRIVGNLFARVFSEQASEFLEKMLFRRVRPPELTDENVSSWLTTLLPEGAFFGGLDTFLKDGYFGNPRYIKRFASTVHTLSDFLQEVDEHNPVWGGLKRLPNKNIAMQVLTKTAAFAMAERYSGFYESVRKPDPGQLIACELSAFDGSPLPCVLVDPQSRTPFQSAMVGPRELVDFLKTGPRLSEYPDAVNSAIMAVEMVLPPSVLRWRTPMRLEAPDLDGLAEEVKTTRVSQRDRDNVSEVIARWTEALGEDVEVPKGITSFVQSFVPDSAVEVFLASSMQPVVPSLVLQADSIASAGKLREATWLLFAASLHPEVDGADVDAFASIVNTLDRDNDRTAIADLCSQRFADDDDMMLTVSILLVRSEDNESIANGLQIALRIMGVTEEEIKNPNLRLKDKFDEKAYLKAFLASTDALSALERYDDGLALASAAIKTNTGSVRSAVIRNLARGLVCLGRKEEAIPVYNAAIISEKDDGRSCLWLSYRLEDNSVERLRCLLAAFARDNDDSTFAERIGICLHNREERTRATPWLELAVAMKPFNSDYRIVLAQNLQATVGFVESQKARDTDYIPTPDDATLRDQASEAHRQLIVSIVAGGPIEFQGTVLFDPQNPPAWIEGILGTD
ncbi:P-loop NTPase fold protein [Gemmatimonadota bacterium]